MKNKSGVELEHIRIKDGRVGSPARGLARRLGLMFLIGTMVGSVVAESGNVVAYLLGLPERFSHIFNVLFAVIGLAGVALALYLGHRAGR